MSWDFIVAGAGTAGLTTAIFAAQRGARVLLLEAAERIGGTLHWSSAQMSAAGTRRQAQRGIVEVSFAGFEPGLYMFHAHQSEFAELGWMGFLEVA